MKLYTSTGTKKTISQCNEFDVGLMMVASWRNPKKWPYFAIDNGCYSAYVRSQKWHGISWCPSTFLRLCSKAKHLDLAPDFVVVPDIVAGGRLSLDFSRTWVPILKALYPQFPLYLAVQDGMSLADVSECLDDISGIFVGGSMKWKLRTMAVWTEFAHAKGLRCHVGRMGPVRRMLWAERIGADSIDSTTWVQRKDVLPKYIRGFRDQTTLGEIV